MYSGDKFKAFNAILIVYYLRTWELRSSAYLFVVASAHFSHPPGGVGDVMCRMERGC